MTKQYFNSAEKVTVDNYPYGRLQCEMTFWVEHNPKRGFRTCRRSINPKTGRINNPKKSTYSDLILMYKEVETGHIKFEKHSFNGTEYLNKAFLVLDIHFTKFDAVQIESIYASLYSFTKASLEGSVNYGGAKADDVLPLFNGTIKTLIKGFKDGNNYFNDLELDITAINNAKDADFSPFKLTTVNV